MNSPKLSGRHYIVLVSPSYGGAEKRFFDIFKALRADGLEVTILAASTLVDLLLQDYGDAFRDALIPIEMPAGWSPKAFIANYRKLLRTLPKGSSFHYPMNCLWPLHIGRGDRVSMSVTNCIHLPRLRAPNRSAAWTWLSFFFTDAIDVLSPDIFARMRSYRTAPKMNLTPGGTFIDSSTIAVGITRRPVVAFLSRLVPLKGIDDWLDILEDLWSLIRGDVEPDFAFEIVGHGTLANHVVARVAELSARGVPVRYLGYAASAEYLPSATIVVSMQEVTNYPSRVVAEGLVSGCGVIVRETGDSNQFGTGQPGLSYCRPTLDIDEIGSQILDHFELLKQDAGYERAVKSAAIARFSAGSTTRYFRTILGADRAES